MTTDKLRSAFEFYAGWVAAKGIGPCEDPGQPDHLGHLAFMCRTAVDDLIPAGRVEKSMRWLGFVQGVLVARGFFTLAEVKGHSRPDDPDPPTGEG